MTSHSEDQQSIETQVAAQNQTIEMVRQAQQGESRATDQLVEHLSGRFLAMIMLRMGPAMRRRHDPEDVLQEVWIETLGSMKNFDPERGTPFASWVFAIIRRTLDRLNKKDFRRPIPEATFRQPEDEGPAFGEATGALSSPSLRAYRRESVDRLVQAVEGLPKEQKDAVSGFWFEELPAAAIAERMGKSRQAVYMLVMRANKALCQHLEVDSRSLPGAWSAVGLP